MTVLDQPDIRPPMPRQSPLGRLLALLRNTWRGLTSMRTALVLLFLLALGAIPGALLPQRSLNPQKVAQYLADRPTLGPWMDRLQLFDVFGSFWFTAIYALLFISLVGCVVPRIYDHYRALRTPPVRVPRNLARLPHHHRVEVALAPEDVIAQARSRLRGWRVAVRPGDRDGEVTLSAEKGYLRELGNLVFHVSLLGVLVTFALGKLFGYEGNVIVIADDGPGFCTTSPAVFDSFKAGNVNDGTGMTPLCVRVKDFKADYLDSGQAEMFTSNIAYQAGNDLRDNHWRDTTIQVNHPLRVAGDRLYLQGHGFAPTFTVTFPNGQTRTETMQWRPDDARTFLSSGALRIDPPGGMYPTEQERRKNQIAIEGLFAPKAFMHGSLLTSAFPRMDDPAVAVDIYRGDTGLDTGKPQSIFGLDQEMVRQGRLTKEARVNLRPGESATLPNGTKVTFDGAKEYVNLQVSHDPAQQWVLVSAIAMLGGLLVSLVVRRRRIWLRATPAGTVDQRHSVVEMGGLARSDQAGWGSEFDRLRDRLLDTTPAPTTGE
ncbi:cytochrome c biogenesis protein ResB [Nocardia panacis]|uniref:Cytochrome c biogenesis protein ResB n=1 Tax=Nocardia panacis TaxID=2340916 RepID=A0A3A4KCY3_9NOCA|nr:cytochrome c biogenesis protein ResB [Nocardia panacis]RJO76541.1 cytochrome c biogenesis protein ResB [Nocardia panacis]